MKSSFAIRRLTIMILLSIFGSYCFGVAHEESMISKTSEKIASNSIMIVQHIEKFIQESYRWIKNVWISFFQEEQDVKIQSDLSLKRKEKLSRYDQDDSYYVDRNKCQNGSGQEDCLFNETFFGDTFFGTGSENYDELLSIDYSQYPTDEQE